MIPSAPGNVFGAALRTAFLVSGNVMPITDIREIGLTRGGTKGLAAEILPFLLDDEHMFHGAWRVLECRRAVHPVYSWPT